MVLSAQCGARPTDGRHGGSVTLVPVGALPLSEQIHRQLLEAIVDGSLSGTLPSERELAQIFQVNRHVVREAIKRLQQASLVEVSQGGATRVLTIAEHAHLDLLPSLLVPRGSPDPAVGQAVLEFRACIAADAARLCALRSPDVGPALIAHLPSPGTTDDELGASNLAYWTAIIDGTGNVAYRLALNTLVAGLDTLRLARADTALLAALHEEYRREPQMRALARAIGDGDGDKARRCATSLLVVVAGRDRQDVPAPRVPLEGPL
jgi:DNA-binding FadR family transcriptional regulator